MKKSKVAIALVLALIVVLLCAYAPSYSWFSRGHSLNGERMMMGDTNAINNSFSAYNGYNVSMSTSSSPSGVEGSYETPVTTSAGLSESSGLLYSRRKYFCTTITNSSGTAQNVSLFAKTLSIPTANNGSLALGVNGPTRSYRDYSALVTPSTKTTRNMMRIYFEKDNNVSGWNGTSFYICWNEDPNTNTESLNSTGSNGTYTHMEHVGGTGFPNQYYADIPKTATHAFFCVENWGTNNNGHENWGQRSQTLYNLAGDGQSQTSSKLYKITSAYKDNDSNSNHLVHTPPYTVTGNCINSYYDNIFVAVGNTFNAGLQSGEFIGTLKYYSGNTSVFTVNENTGVITPVGAGTATLYTKSQGGSYPDSQQVETTVTVTADANYVFYDVPIVRNIKIPIGESVNVYWYVINNNETTSLRYTIDSIYLGM